MDLVMRKKSFK